MLTKFSNSSILRSKGYARLATRNPLHTSEEFSSLTTTVLWAFVHRSYCLISLNPYSDIPVLTNKRWPIKKVQKIAYLHVRDQADSLVQWGQHLIILLNYLR